MAAYPFSVLALVGVSTVSLVLTVLNYSFWCIHREDRTPLWLAMWLGAGLVFTVGRLFQYFPLNDSFYIIAPRLVLTAATALAWAGYTLGNDYIGYRPPRREKTLVIAGLGVYNLALWATDLVLTRHGILRIATGGDYHGVLAGPLYLPAGLIVLAVGCIAPVRLIGTPGPSRRNNLLMAAAYTTMILCSVADFLAVAFNWRWWLRLTDFSYIPMGVLFTYIQVSRIGSLYRQLDITVQERTHELQEANEGLRAEVVERKQAQEALAVSEELYRMLFDANPQPAWVYDLETLCFLLVNDAAVARYGYSSDEFLHLTIADIRPEEELPALRDNLATEHGVLQWSGPWRHRKKDGTIIIVEILSHALLFKGRAARLVMANEITDRVRAEQALQESEEKYRTLVESAKDGIAIIQDGRVKYVNPRLAEMRGEPMDSILDQRFDTYVHPEERERILERYARRMAGFDEPTTYETALIRKDGTRLPSEITTGTITYQGKRAEIILVRDISEHKRAEQALQRQLREMTVLKAVAAACAESTYSDELIERITETVGNSLYPDNCGVLVLEPDREHWRPHPSYQGTAPEYLLGLHPLSEGLCGKAMASERAVRVDDIRNEPEYRELTPGILSEVAVPIIVNGRVFGCLNAESTALDGFTEHDERLLTTIAESMSTAIEKIRLLQVEKRRREEAEILYNTTRDLVMERDLSALLQVIVERAAGIISAPSAAIYLSEPENRQVRCVVSYNTPQEHVGTILKFGEGAGGIVAETGQPLIVEDYRTWQGRAPIYEDERPFISILTVPMRWQGDVIGVLQIMDNTKVRSFTDEELRMVNLFANQAAMAVQNARLFKETSQRAQEAAVIAEVGRDISETLQLDVTLEQIAAHAKKLFRARTCAVYLPVPETSRLVAIAALGPFAEEIKADPINLGGSVLGWIALNRRGEIVNNIGNDPRAVLVPGTEDIPIEHLMGVPVLRQDQLEGLIAVWRVGEGQEFTSGDLDFLTSLAGQVGVAIQNARLFENLQGSNLELSKAYDTTLEGWARALEMRDKETLGHSRRVTELTLGLAHCLGVPEAELTNIRRGVLLHDIGKMGIPDALLKKTGPLDTDEWAEMRKHPRYAYELLHPIGYLRPALDIPYAHHENWDGSGYPRGLKGTEIPLAARMFAIVDVYDALLYDRPYRKAWPRDQVLDYLREQSGVRFDPQITEAFLSLVDDITSARVRSHTA